MTKLRVMAKAKLSDFRVKHHLYKCPCVKLHAAIKRKAGAVRQYTQVEVAKYIERGGLTGCLNGKGVPRPPQGA